MDDGTLLPSNNTSEIYNGSKMTTVYIENDYDYYDPCTLPSSPDHRWYFVAIAGTSLSFVSIICNALITVVLLKKKYAHFYFLGLLAASDMFLSICYGPVIAMDVIKNRLQGVARKKLQNVAIFPE
uniref:G-protein coupled receptors family 1 profile domain-containing protein n=1 Tax=Panagrolaimus sp. JU765 TaxID=591449 RepID=A0AC34Q7D5_9BILA